MTKKMPSIIVFGTDDSANNYSKGKVFEDFVEELLTAAGYEITRRNALASGHEEDLLGFEAIAGVPVIVECKGTSSKVTVGDFLRLAGILDRKIQLSADNRWTALLVSASGFTPQVYQEREQTGISRQPNLMGPEEIVAHSIRHHLIYDPEMLVQQAKATLSTIIELHALLICPEGKFWILELTDPDTSAVRFLIVSGQGTVLRGEHSLFKDYRSQLEKELSTGISNLANFTLPSDVSSLILSPVERQVQLPQYDSLESLLSCCPDLFQVYCSIKATHSEFAGLIANWHSQIETPLLGLLNIHLRSHPTTEIRKVCQAVVFLESYFQCLAKVVNVVNTNSVDSWTNIKKLLKESQQRFSVLKDPAKCAMVLNLGDSKEMLPAAAKDIGTWIPAILVTFLANALVAHSFPYIGQQICSLSELANLPRVPEDCKITVRLVRLVRGQILELSAVTSGAAEFIALTRISHQFQRISDFIADICTSLGSRWPLITLRCGLDEVPAGMNSSYFTVDTDRIITLLMGKELYGDKDIWFRELVQNSIDACRLRRQVDSTAPEGLIAISQDDGGRLFTIIDNGIGMNQHHVLSYLAKVGRTYWRSQELEKLLGDKGEFIALGKYGIGFLSIFQVASEVVVTSRFFQEDVGCRLRISTVSDPFFIETASDLPAGTSVLVRFRDDYSCELPKIAEKFLAYKPRGVSFDGFPPIPTSFRDLSILPDNLIKQLAKGWIVQETVLELEEYEMKAIIPLYRLEAKKRFRDIPDTRVLILNDGIIIQTRSNTWLGPERKDYYETTPGIGLDSIYVGVNFKTGRAPVSVSRDRLNIEEDFAKRIQKEMVSMVLQMWKNELMNVSALPLKERRKKCLSLLFDNVPPPTDWWRRDEYSSCEDLAKGAADLYSILCPIRTVDTVKLEESFIVPRDADILGEQSNIPVVSESLAKSGAFQSLIVQKGVRFYIIADTKREYELMEYAFGSEQVRWLDMRDIWAEIDFDESICSLSKILPADCAVVSAAYFEKDCASYRLPGNLPGIPRGDEAVGHTRSEVASIYRPRIVLNIDHRLWCTLESFCKAQDHRSSEFREFRLLVEKLIDRVVDETTKGRRRAALSSVLRELKKFIGDNLPIVKESAFKI